MPAPAKVKLLDELKSILSEKSDFIMATYSGLSVDEIGDLRGQIREKNAKLKVIKNNIFKLALKESDAHDDALLESTSAELKGPVAVAFSDAELPGVAKVLVEFGKKNDKVAIKAGCLEGKFLDQNGVKGIADLPTKDEMLGIIGRGLNTPAQKIATGMNEIIASLARGIQAVGDKNG